MVLPSTLTVQVDSVIDSASSAQEHDLQTALEGLQSLQSFQVNTELLTETQAGKKIRKLTKHSHGDIAQAAKQLIDTWKDCVRQEQEEQAVGGEALCLDRPATRTHCAAFMVAALQPRLPRARSAQGQTRTCQHLRGRLQMPNQ